MAYRRRSPIRPGEGWHSCRPETVAIAEPSDNLEVRIYREYGGSGFELTITDHALERSETSLHDTVEEAKEHAGAVLRLGLDWK
jgi:hypothetical protein